MSFLRDKEKRLNVIGVNALIFNEIPAHKRGQTGAPYTLSTKIGVAIQNFVIKRV